MEREKLLALNSQDNDYDKRMLIPNNLSNDLNWWKKSLDCLVNPIKTGDFRMEIYTDASGTGYGATNGLDSMFGFWNEKEKLESINYRELLVVKLALARLADKVSNCQVLLRIDNTTAISYINKMGGIKYQKYNKLTRSIWQWAEARNVFLVATYISSSDNVNADRLSRLGSDDTEWELSNAAYTLIVNRFGYPNIDLFASKANKKCERFCSWMPDKEAENVDALV